LPAAMARLEFSLVIVISLSVISEIKGCDRAKKSSKTLNGDNSKLQSNLSGPFKEGAVYELPLYKGHSIKTQIAFCITRNPPKEVNLSTRDRMARFIFSLLLSSSRRFHCRYV